MGRGLVKWSNLCFIWCQRRVQRAKGTSGFPASISIKHAKSMRGRSGRRPRVARECHSAGGPSSKAVSCSRDRGCNGHRILRRVPNDRRHPSPKRGVGFHETAQSVGLAISASSDPLQPVKTRASGEDKETGNVGEARRSAEDVTRGRDRGVRGSAACAPWEENAHALSPAREGMELEVSTQ
jgi:hypothetical protein